MFCLWQNRNNGVIIISMIKMLKTADIVLLGLLLGLSLLPLLPWGAPPDACYAEIRLEGRVLDTVPLTGHQGAEERSLTFTQAGTAHHYLIRLEQDTIAISAADCPDKICVKTGAISQPGEIIACLPHKLIIEIKTARSMP